MPCSITQEEEEYYRRIVEDKRIEEMNRLTRLLCYSCRNLPKEIIFQNPELKEWYKQHMENDRKAGR